MGKSKFPGKPSKLINRKRVSVLQTGECDISNANCDEAEYLPSAQISLWNNRNETKIFRHYGDIQFSTLESPERTGETETRFKDKVNFSKFTTSCAINTNKEHDNLPNKKKTVTFKSVLETSDDASIIKKVYNPGNIPLVPIIKRECLSRSVRLKKSDCIVRPSRLTEIIKNNTNRGVDQLVPSTPSIQMEVVLPEPNGKCELDSNNLEQNENVTVGDKRFILPKRSAHSCRVIKPNKRFLDDTEISNRNTKKNFFITKKSIKNQSNEDNCQVSNKYSFEQQENIQLNKKSGNNEVSNSSIQSSECKQEEIFNNKNLGFLGRKSDFLLAGAQSKSILREPRLHFGVQLQENETNLLHNLNSFSLSLASKNSGNSTTVNYNTCGVCGVTNAHKTFHFPKKFGIYSCEACRKFISKTIKKLALSASIPESYKSFHCSKTVGSCLLVLNSKNNLNIKKAFKERCSACWLKKCLQTFHVPPGLKKRLMAMMPDSLINDDLIKDKSTTSNINKIIALSDKDINSLPTNQLLSWAESQTIFPTTSKIMPLTNPLVQNNTTFGSSPVIKSQIFDKSVFGCNKLTSDKDKLNDEINSIGENEDNWNLKIRKKLRNTTNNSNLLIEPPKRQRIDLKGPRVKHVCRSASIVLGQNIATFPNDDQNIFDNTNNLLNSDIEINKNSNSIDFEDRNCKQCVQHDKEFNLSPCSSPSSPPSQDDEIITTIDETKNKKSDDIPKPSTRKITKPTLTTNSWNINNNILPKKINESITQNISNLISIDFWENYDPAEVSQSGFGIITTDKIPVHGICFLCGSAGLDTLIFCSCCCEPYHQYCVEDEYNLKHSSLDDTIINTDDISINVSANINVIKKRLNWLCPRCTVCYTCNMSSGAKVKCLKCQKNYHTTCLGTSKRLSGADRPLICANCLKCKSCSTTKVSKFVGNLPMCSQCFKLRKKGNYCPMCQKCYEDNDFDLKMMECGDCHRWVHAKCEGLSDEQYNMLSILPEHIEFICTKCSKDNSQANIWRDEVLAQFKSGLLTVVKLLSKSRSACALLKISPRKKSIKCTCQAIQSSRNITFKNIDEKDIGKNDNDSELNDEITIDYKEQNIKCYCRARGNNNNNNLSLVDIKHNINSEKYVSLAEFNYDMNNIILASGCDDLMIVYKEILSETFPWFQNDTKACTDALEEDMFDSSTYIDNNDNNTIYDQQVPEIDLPENIENYFGTKFSTIKNDTRICMFCKGIGEGISNEESRFLYCGQNIWVHINCAMWSAEVFEEIDGSLQNVHSALSRGRLIKCTYCFKRGATIGCNIKSCGQHYHFNCARKVNCAFMINKTIYCPEHINEVNKKKCKIEENFDVSRPVYVELDRKKKKFVDSNIVKFFIGSLEIKKLGKIFPKLSDTYEALIPIGFLCTRLYWSTKQPWKIVEYTIKTVVQNNFIHRNFDTGKNFTVDHSNNLNTVQYGLNQIARWHNGLIFGDENETTTTTTTLKQETRSVKQFLESVGQNITTNDEITEDEPQNNADLLPPEIKDAIFEDLPHEILDGISMLDIFPKLMIYEDMINYDTKTDTYNCNDNTKFDNCSEDDDFDQTLQKDFEMSNSWPLMTSLSHIDDTMLTNVRPILTNRDIKKNKLEILSRGLNNNRNTQRQVNLSWNCKLDSTFAKRRKLNKSFQDIRIPESIILSLGCRKDNITSVIDRRKIQQNDDCRMKTFSWSAAKKYSADIYITPENNTNNTKDSTHEKFKISQLDGMDDILHDNHIYTENINNNLYIESQVKCDRCNCTYRTHDSYQRHLINCEPLSTSDSESETPSPDISQNNIINNELPVSFLQNYGQNNQICSNINNTNQNLQIQCLNLNHTEATNIYLNTTKNIPIQNQTNLIQKITTNPIQQQQQQQQFISLQGIQKQNIGDICNINNKDDNLNSTNLSYPILKSINQSTVLNDNTQNLFKLPIDQYSTDNSLYVTNVQKTSNRTQKTKQISNISPNKNKTLQNKSNQKKGINKIQTPITNINNQIIRNQCEVPGLILQQNNTTQPFLLQSLGNGQNNLMSYVTDNQNAVQYLTIPTNNDYKHTQAQFLTTNPLVQGSFIQSDSSGNLLLTNTANTLPMLSASLQLPQTTHTPIIGTIIQQPQTNPFACGVMATDQMVLGTTPTLEVLTNPTMLLANQPVYYGLETIVQNTVMSSQQFVSTAMQGVLSQNSSFSATTTQVFQASKIEPIVEMPTSYVILNDGTIMSQPTNTQTNIMSANLIQQQQQQQPIQTTPHHIQTSQIGIQQIQPIFNLPQHQLHTSQQTTNNFTTISPTKPIAKSSPIVVTKIAPQIINKVLPNIPQTTNNAQQFIQKTNTNPILITNNNFNTQNNFSKIINNSTKQNKILSSNNQQQQQQQQQQILKPKICNAQTNQLPPVQVQPIQKKLNMIRPISKVSSVTIKPKIITKPVTTKTLQATKCNQNSSPILAPKQQIITNLNGLTYKEQLKDDIKSNINNQININLQSIEQEISNENKLTNFNNIENKILSPENTIPSSKIDNLTFHPLLQNQNQIQHSTSSLQLINTSNSSSIQLPVAPFIPQFGSNIPTNIVNPIQQNNNPQNISISRPTNRVLPMQTLQQKIPISNVPEIKLNEVENDENEIIKEKYTKKPFEILKNEEENNIFENNKKSDSPDQIDYSVKDNRTKILNKENQINYENDTSIKNETETQIITTDFDDNINNENVCDQDDDNISSSSTASPEVKEKISEILENLENEDCNKNDNRNICLRKEKSDLNEQKENVEPLDMNILKKSESYRNTRVPLSIKTSGPRLLYEIQSEDGFTYKSTSIDDIWGKVFDAVQESRKNHGLSLLPEGPLADMCGIQMLGLKTNAIKYLIEQLPGVEKCTKYIPKYHEKTNNINHNIYSSDQEDINENQYGAARCEQFSKRSEYDMFSWLASRHRKQPVKVVATQTPDSELITRRGSGSNLPMAMKYRTLKETYKDYVGVFRSYIHGRGLYCTKDIEAGEMVIEYAGELIRSTLTDKRERYYDSKGIGCYMFKIDENFVVDATMRGNAARFINHSCDPNCYSKVVDILGHKHIIIFALRRIVQGEELTYDYKFPFEDVKIPCSCDARKCRKYLN